MDVKHIAKLANLPLSDKELVGYKVQLEKVLEYVEQLQKVDTSGVAETSQITGKTNVTREDHIEACPLLVKGYIKVKAIFGNE